MKVNFKENAFYADMNNSSEYQKDSSKEFSSFVKNNKSLVCGIFAILLSVINLLFGVIININTYIFVNSNNIGVTHWITVLLVLSVILTLISIVFGVFSVISYTKSNQNSSAVIGLIISIIAFVVCILGLTFNVVVVMM